MAKKRFLKPIDIATPRKQAIAPMLSREQSMLQEIFSGQSFWGLPEDSLPKLHQTLMIGDGETGKLFGLK